MPFFAHSGDAAGEWETVREHLSEVAEIGAAFAAEFGEERRGYVAGLLHDLGKYGDLFQRRLRNEESGIDHWSAGAWVSLIKYREAGVPVALAIEGHHIGLRQWAKPAFLKLNPAVSRPPEAPRLSEANFDVLLSRLADDGLPLPPDLGEAPPLPAEAIASMVETRMLFSALTDADFLATEGHFDPDKGQLRRAAESLDAPSLISRLLTHMGKIRTDSRAATTVNGLREDLLYACGEAAQRPAGIYTLTAPTGSGKTLALLRFALEHARIHGQHRVVVVLPFLSIIDQTVSVYREALAEGLDEDVARLLVLEDHSLAGSQQVDDKVEIGSARQRALLAENWDAPIIITTSVQFLESLFSNSPAACRKLHRLANSVVIFDEVQTLPLRIAIPTLAALSHFSRRYRTTVVFSTATQPAFDHLDDAVKKLSVAGWQPREIVPPELNLYARASRVSARWPAEGERPSIDDLAGSLAALDQALCIVNVKRHARQLFLKLEPELGDNLFHLSTDMCPQHRRVVLDGVRERLGAGQPCVVVATQCVEAGVDLDFPVVYRALAPLDAIAQAAGRCNRNGKLSKKGELHVFHPADARYPSADYKQAAALTAEMLARYGGELDLDAPDVFREYYQRLYLLASVGEHNPELRQGITALDFVEVRKHYQFIEKADSINVLTAYDPARFEELATAVRGKGLSRRWVSAARPLTVGLFRPRGAHRIYDFLEPARLRDRSPAPDWFIHLRPEHYHPKLGLQVPQEMEFMSV